MTLKEAWGKNVRITFIGGDIMTGVPYDYTPAGDNPENKASICIGDTIFFEDEIEKIELLNK